MPESQYSGCLKVCPTLIKLVRMQGVRQQQGEDLRMKTGWTNMDQPLNKQGQHTDWAS